MHISVFMYPVICCLLHQLEFPRICENSRNIAEFGRSHIMRRTFAAEKFTNAETMRLFGRICEKSAKRGRTLLAYGKKVE